MAKEMDGWQMPGMAGAPRLGLPAMVKLFSIVLITLSALSLLLIGYIASRKADDIAAEKQVLLLENVLRDRQSLLARDQLGLARWDRSVQYITLKFRASYVIEEFVSSLWYDFGHERSFLIGPGGRVLMSAWQDKVDLTARDLKPGDDLKAIADLALTRHHAHRTTIKGGFGQQSVPASQVHAIAAFGFAEVDGEVMLATAMAIVPDDGEVALPEGDPVILVSARPIDADLVADLNSQLEYENLQFRRNGDGMLVVKSADGQTLGSFDFGLFKPGADIWTITVPAVVLLCGLMLAASFVLGRYIGRLSERLEESEKRNRELAHRDALSGLANRLCFDNALNEAAERLAHAPFAVIACDLDRFKAVNDLHGHGAGDEVIRVVAERLRETVGENGMVGRVGGDEFVILVHAFRDRPRLSMLAQSIIASVSRPITLSSGPEVDIGISLGLATAPENGSAARPIMAMADRALYASKDGGRGRAFFAEDLAPEEGAGTDTATRVDAA
ncbi:diguanylate cyclase [Agrobacterium albertimagni AOL15]|uniref:Diguanylate cyclase n=1 Tax=Agrobacterium albertimagni AOL15 TaxID=1156935 RepID=K2Q100_9HYPH|nr:diguanylate cyclase [Agrobacterium albertimagni]EKF57309.1 diguanylate cyclase [Agrobacterium albertimagni AOL15]